MKKTILIAILTFGSFSCSEEQLLFTEQIAAEIVEINPPGPTHLILVNQLEENYSISAWKMTGYEFTNLEIPPGNSEQFLLINGMTEGYKDITVTAVLSSSIRSFSVTDKVNFNEGGVTKITISGYEACNGYRIEWSW